MRCRAWLGLRPRVLPASPSRIVPSVSALLVPVRAALRDRPLAPSQRLLRLRPASATVQSPAVLTDQDVTDVALAFPPFMVAPLPLFCHTIKVNLIESALPGPNAPAHRELPTRGFSASVRTAIGQRCGGAGG